jgi:hypothetical protein
VIDRVADDVGQRIADHLDHLAIELDVAALDIDQHLLAELGRQVADHARQATNRFSIRCMRVRVIASRISAMIPRQALERAVDRHVAGRFAQAAGELVAGQHHVGDAAHHPVEQFDRQADGARRARRLALRFGGRGARGAAPSAPGASASISAVVARGHRLAGLDRGDHLADAVDDREHGADQRAVGLAAPARTSASASSAAWLSASSRGKFEEAAIALDGVDEAEMLSSRARSSGSASQATISPPSASSISRHSATKSAIRSSIGVAPRSPEVEGLMPPRS